MIRRPYRVLYLCTVVFGLVAGMAPHAFSWYQRQHGSACSVGLGGPSNFVGWGNISTTGSLTVNCSMPDASFTPKVGAAANNAVGVFVTDGHPSQPIVAFRCVDWWNVDGSTCGASVQTSGTGTQGLNPPNTDGNFWTNTDDHFGYVSVVLPLKSGSSTSIIKGITDISN